jgi:hypothetical protein
VVDGRVQIVDESALIVPIAKLAAPEILDELRGVMRGYRNTLEFDRRVLLEGYELHDIEMSASACSVPG